MIAEKYTAEIEAILAKYPADQKRSAVMPLLYLAQRDGGYITKEEMIEIGEILGITPTDVASIIGFYTLYHDQPEGNVRIQVCNDLPCALRGADEFLDKLCENLGIKVGETTSDGAVTVEAVMCLAACDKIVQRFVNNIRQPAGETELLAIVEQICLSLLWLQI